MSKTHLPAARESFESLKQTNEHGAEYWSARKLQPLLGYRQWRRFQQAVDRAKASCATSGNNPEHHFAGAGKPITGGKGAVRRDRDSGRPAQGGLTALPLDAAMSLKHSKGHAGPLLVLEHSSKILKGKSLRGITIDCGWRDQYHIHYGSRLLSQRLAEAGIRHRYEEFDDDQSDIDYRMDVSLPFLYRAMRR